MQQYLIVHYGHLNIGFLPFTGTVAVWGASAAAGYVDSRCAYIKLGLHTKHLSYVCENCRRF